MNANLMTSLSNASQHYQVHLESDYIKLVLLSANSSASEFEEEYV